MARPRAGLNARLPPNLSLHASGQYRYVHPVTKRHHYIGRDRQQAIQTANSANAQLIPRTSHLDKILNNNHRLSEAIDLFVRESMPERNWKPKTMQDYSWRLQRIRSDLGARIVESLTVKDCAQYLREVTDSQRARKQYQSVLIWVLNSAINEGWIESNAASTIHVPKSKRERPRLYIDEFWKLHERAEPWLQIAMEFGLFACLRRGDVVNLKFEDIWDGCLHVIPQKTEDSTAHRLQFEIAGALEQTIARCRDGVPSPYLVHRLPKRLPRTAMRSKDRAHHTQVLSEQLTREFAALVRESGLWSGHAAKPCFHEIRSLGADLHRKAGMTLDQVQQLMGHASEAMTKDYLRGHEAPWTRVVSPPNLPPRPRHASTA